MLPENLLELTLGLNYYQEIEYEALPASLKRLILSRKYHLQLPELPINCKIIRY
jgi:hypothetical protein